MSYQPPPGYTPQPQGLPPSPGRLALAIAILGLGAAWLAMPSGWFTPEIRKWWFGLEPSGQRAEIQEPPPSGGRPAPRATPARTEKETWKYVGGVWRSNSGSGFTYILEQNKEQVEIYHDHPTLGQVKLGSGRFEGGVLRATIKPIRENRRAELTLFLSDDGLMLEGTFTGAHSQETGNVTLSRVGPREAAG